ncbi:protein transport protein SEC24 [Nematocida sp. ERTm5]|nr:protein transport protein SEC24 [Nematocida sp. ERTm5]
MHRMSSLGAAAPPNTDEIIPEIKALEYTYTRSTFTSAPTKRADLKKTKIPFIISTTILPVNEQPVKRVEVIPRCKDCRAYLNTYSEVIPPGYKWRCSICRVVNDSPSPLHSYGGSLRVFSPSENTENNKRVSTNPILTESILEFVSPSERNTPPPASLMFLVECTSETIEKGIFSAVLHQISESLDYLNDPHERATITIILISSVVELVRLNQPDLIVDRINEVEGALPMLMDTEYTARIKDIKKDILNKISKIEEYALQCVREPGNNFGLALKLVKHLSHRRAEVFAFLSTPPSLKSGAITKPSLSLRPCMTFYEHMANSLVESNVSVNIYVLTSKTVEIPALLPLVEKTGGYIKYYPAYIGHYSQDKDALRLDLMQHLSLDNGNNAYCRVRVSNEVSIKKYWGVDVQNDGLIRLSRLSRGKTISFEIDYEDDLVLEGLTVQIATIYTNVIGERIVRILNFTIGLGPTAIDILGLVHGIALKALDAEVAQRGMGIKTVLKMSSEVTECTGLMGTMSVFPNLIHGLIKNKVFKNVSSDLRGITYWALIDEPMKTVDAIIYPTLVRLDTDVNESESDEVILPSPMRLSGNMVGAEGVYYLDCGIIAYVFIGNAASCNLFEGVQGRASINPQEKKYEKIRNIMDYMVDGRISDPVVYIVHQGGHSFLLEGLQSMLLDDGASPVSASYHEYYNRFVAKGYLK